MRPITITPTAVMGTNLQLPAIEADNQQMDDDDTDILAYNLSNLLLANYENDTDLLVKIMSNLQNEGIRNWKERGNLRLSYGHFDHHRHYLRKILLENSGAKFKIFNTFHLPKSMTIRFFKLFWSSKK